jgi:Protein of unknown function (DUF2742)
MADKPPPPIAWTNNFPENMRLLKAYEAAEPVRATGNPAVYWWAVHEFMEAALAQANTGPLPWPGTPAWCELADGDPRKLLALAEFGVHHALRVETAQAAAADASRAVSAAANWTQISSDVRFRADRPWLKRRAS